MDLFSLDNLYKTFIYDILLVLSPFLYIDLINDDNIFIREIKSTRVNYKLDILLTIATVCYLLIMLIITNHPITVVSFSILYLYILLRK